MRYPVITEPPLLDGVFQESDALVDEAIVAAKFSGAVARPIGESAEDAVM